MANENEVKINVDLEEGLEMSIDTTGLDVTKEEAEIFLKHIAETIFGGIVYKDENQNNN